MAKIPLAIGSRSLETGTVVQYPTNDPVGKATEQAGSKVEHIGGELATRLQNRNAQIERFANLQSFDRFKTDTLTEVDQAKQNMQPGAVGLHDKLIETFEKRSGEWLATVPQHLQQEFRQRIDTYRSDFSRSAAQIENAEANRFQIEGVQERVTQAKQDIGQIGPDVVGQWTKDVDELIDAAPAMTPVQKAAGFARLRLSILDGQEPGRGSARG
jgi:hypothetical protein